MIRSFLILWNVLTEAWIRRCGYCRSRVAGLACNCKSRIARKLSEKKMSIRGLNVLCALWFGLMAGFFFAYSATVMPGLAGPSPQNGMAAMQAINDAVANPFFASGFWVALALAAVGALISLIVRPEGWAFLLLGCALYGLGVFITTGAGNVPLNRALAVLDPASAEGLAAWARYQADWTQLNHVRMAAAFCAAGLVLIPLLRR
jgi:uncharacterized membrane protein